MKEEFEQIGKRLEIENFLDLIADETITTESERTSGIHAEDQPPRSFDVGYH